METNYGVIVFGMFLAVHGVLRPDDSPRGYLFAGVLIVALGITSATVRAYTLSGHRGPRRHE